MIKIKQIYLNNFFNHVDTKISLNSLNIFAGDNGAGKTPVIQGILYIFKGFAGNMADIHDLRGEDNLVHNGADEMSVSIQLEVGSSQSAVEYELVKEHRRGESTRIMIKENGKEKIFNNPDSSERKTDQQDVWNILGIDYRQISAVVDSFYFMSLPFEGREQLVFDLMGIGWTEEILREKLQSSILSQQSSVDISQSAVSSQESPVSSQQSVIIDEYVGKILECGFEEAQKQADFCWGDIKTKLENPINLDEYDEEIRYRKKELMVSKLDINEIRNDLDSLDKDRSEMEKKRGWLEKDAEFDVVGKDQEVLEINETILELQEKIKGYHPLETLNERLKSYQQDSDEIVDRISSLKVEITLKNKESEIVSDQINELKEMEHGGKCNFCKSDLNADQVKKLLKDLEKELDNIQNELIDLNNDYQDFSDQRIKKDQSILHYQQLIELIEITTEKIAEKESEHDEIKQEIAQKKDKAIKAREELQNIATRLKNIKQANNILIEILHKCKSYKNAADRLAEFEKEKPENEKRSEIYDRLRKLLQPDGILKDIVRSQIKPFNDRLQFLNAYELTDPIQLNDDWSINIGDRHEKQVHQRGSEIMRMGFIFQEIFSYLSKIGLWLCDGTDILSTINRWKLQRLAADIHQDYGNILVTVTKAEPQPLSRDILKRGGIDSSLLERFSYLWIQEGQVKEIPSMERISHQA